MMGACRRTLLWMLFSCAVVAQTSPRPTPASGSGLFTISGTVVSATTGTPLDRAEITLSTTEPTVSPIGQAVTGENGEFRFDHLEAGNYRVEAFRRGYIAAGYQEHDGFYTGVVTGPGLDTRGLRLALDANAVIGGAVTDDSGEPVAGARVRLFRQESVNGEERVVGTQTEMTDDNGTYEFSRVRAGTFYVSVTASPWYAFHPNPKADTNGNLVAADQQPHSPLDVAYPTIFYENGTDSDSATPVTVKSGDHVEADFSLHAVPSLHIQVRLQAPGENRPVAMPQLMQQVFGSDENLPASEFTVGTRSGGMVADLSGIAPGNYELRQFGQSGDGNRTASVDLSSNQTIDLASSSAASGIDVSGKIALVSGSRLPNHTNITFQSIEDANGRGTEVLASDGTFALRSMPPGHYDVHVSSSEGELAVLQMAATGAAIQGNRITVGTQPVLLAATLARGMTTVSGFVRQNGKGVGGAMILLIPRNGGLRDLYRRDQSNSDGSFTLSRVVPGDYTVVAIDDGWTLEWGRAGAMARYLARGLHVQVTGQARLILPGSVEVQPH
jgi:protocatechuate 3,4-dioxygenase beta subunit